MSSILRAVMEITDKPVMSDTPAAYEREAQDDAEGAMVMLVDVLAVMLGAALIGLGYLVAGAF